MLLYADCPNYAWLWVDKTQTYNTHQPNTGHGFKVVIFDYCSYKMKMSVVGVASLFALGSAASGLQDVNTNQDTAGQDSSTEVASSQPSQFGGSPDMSTSNQSCSIQCNRMCSYPGHCHRYIDSNGNNQCDLSECV
jgi:hypothetical protein